MIPGLFSETGAFRTMASADGVAGRNDLKFQREGVIGQCGFLHCRCFEYIPPVQKLLPCYARILHTHDVEPCREGHQLGQRDSATRRQLQSLALEAAMRLAQIFHFW